MAPQPTLTVGVLLLWGAASPPAPAETVVLQRGQSVQRAIDDASDGDVLLLNDGVYEEAIDIYKIGARGGRKEKAPHRPAWPAEIDRRWGGLDGAEKVPDIDE